MNRFSLFLAISTPFLPLSFNIREEPTTLDPIMVIGNSMPIVSNMHEGLLRVMPDGTIGPGIAESWEVKGNKIIFKLREAFWEDGTRIKAKHFISSAKRLLSPYSPSKYLRSYFCIKNSIKFNKGLISFAEVGVKAIGDTKVEIELEHPSEDPIRAYGPIFAFAPLAPLKIVENKILSSGPYKLTKWDPRVSITLEKNRFYYKSIKIEKLEIIVVKNITTARNMFYAGQLDLVLNSEMPGKPYSREAKVSYLQFNPSLSHELRAAIAYAIDREELCSSVLEDGSKPAYALVPESLKGKKESFRKDYGETLFQESVEEAKKLVPKDQKKLRFLCSNSERSVKIAQYIQATLLKKLGIELAIEIVPMFIKFSRVKKGDFEITLSGWMVDYTGPPFDFFSIYMSDAPDVIWENSEYDKLVERAYSSFRIEDLFDALAKAERKICASYPEGGFPIAPLYFGKSYYLIRKNIKGVHINSGFGSPNFREATIE